MHTKITYKGSLNGTKMIWCGFFPPEEGIIIEERITIYYPDEGKIFKKDNQYYFSVINDGIVDITTYTEVPESEYLTKVYLQREFYNQ